MSDDERTSPIDVKSAMSAMREAARVIEREESMDAMEALSAAAESIQIDKKQDIIKQAGDDPFALAAAEVMPAELPKKSRSASIQEDAQYLIQKMKEKNIMPETELEQIKPKPSEAIAIEEDVDVLLGLMKETSTKKPISARYLKMLELQKSQNRSDSPTHGRKGKKHATELSKLSKMLHQSDGTEWGQRLSQSSFKSYNQEMLYRSMRKVADDKKRSGSKSDRHKSSAGSTSAGSSSIHERLHPSHKPVELHIGSGRKKDKTLTYSSYDDARNCTFRPRTNETRRQERAKAAAAAAGSDDEDKKEEEKGHSNFLNRQDDKNRERKEKLQDAMGKKDYDAVVDKRYCPSCKCPQSYDDIKEKRKRCVNCNVEYRTKIAWGDIEASFLRRQSESDAKFRKHRDALAKQLYEDEMRVRRKRVDPATGRVVVEDVSVLNPDGLVWTPAMEEEFLSRQEHWEEVKRRDIAKAEMEMYGSRNAQSKASSVRDDSFLGFDDNKAAATMEMKWTAQMEQEFVNRQEEWDERKRRDLERIEYEMYGHFSSRRATSSRLQDTGRSKYRDANDETLAEYLYHA
jgi:hypothetical protein